MLNSVQYLTIMAERSAPFSSSDWADGRDVQFLRDDVLNRPGQGLIAHDHCACDVLFTDHQPQPVDLEPSLRDDGIRDIPPGFTIPAGDTGYIAVAASAYLTNDGRRQSGESGHVERRRFFVRGSYARHVQPCHPALLPGRIPQRIKNILSTGGVDRLGQRRPPRKPTPGWSVKIHRLRCLVPSRCRKFLRVQAAV